MACEFCGHCQQEQTRALIRQLFDRLEQHMIDNSEQLARIGASTENLVGDISRLTQAGQQLQAALDQAIAETRAEYEAAIKPFADALDVLAAQTPEPQAEA